MKRLLLLSFIACGLAPCDLHGQTSVPLLKLGYTGAWQKEGSFRNTYELGYFHCIEDTYLSHGPSATVVLVRDNKNTYVGPKLSYQYNLVFLGLKADAWFFNQKYFLSPSAGFSMASAGNIHFGYNFCLNDPAKSGTFFQIILHRML